MRCKERQIGGQGLKGEKIKGRRKSELEGDQERLMVKIGKLTTTTTKKHV